MSKSLWDPEINLLFLVPWSTFYENFFQSVYNLLSYFANRQTGRQINADYHITSLAGVNMPQKWLAKQARGQRCLLNLVLLRVCSDSCGSGCRIQDFSISTADFLLSLPPFRTRLHHRCLLCVSFVSLHVPFHRWDHGTDFIPTVEGGIWKTFQNQS